ncbi:MAG: hypothetical protein KKB22_06345 [Candidatus Omnitrophica bacterium]|nr:hypothetical protein [Candidatus Omnitrophota bacterium]
MEKIKKVLKSKITLILIAILFVNGHALCFPYPNDALRLTLGQEDDTLIRIKAVCVINALRAYPEERAYILGPKNTTLLLVSLGIKPAYWSWKIGGIREGELNLIQNISKILGLRFISYNFGNNTKKACFVYNPKELARVFLENKEQLMTVGAYLGRTVDPQKSIEIFGTINLETIVNTGNLETKVDELTRLDEYLTTVGQIPPRHSERKQVYFEPFPVGLAMGYYSRDAMAYLEAKRERIPPTSRLVFLRSGEYDFAVGSIDENIARAIFDKWLKARKAVEDIIDVSAVRVCQ